MLESVEEQRSYNYNVLKGIQWKIYLSVCRSTAVIVTTVVSLDGHGVGRLVARDVDPREVESMGSDTGHKSGHISQHDVPQTCGWQ